MSVTTLPILAKIVDSEASMVFIALKYESVPKPYRIALTRNEPMRCVGGILILPTTKAKIPVNMAKIT
jgi:hypothetical protein